jgi:uncharacterized protein (DUF362 family)
MKNASHHERKKTVSRRGFIQKMAMSYGGILLGKHLPFRHNSRMGSFMPPRQRIPNPYVNSEGKPFVVVVDGNDFNAMLRAGLDAMGGPGKLITADQDVLIKPNCNAVDVYPAISDGAATAALAQEVVSSTSGRVTVGDKGYHLTTLVYNQMNLEEALTGTGAELIHFYSTYDVRQIAWEFEKESYKVYSEVYDAPVIINFGCLKRHFLARMTAAIKNHVGTVRGEGASSSRGYLHSLSGELFLREIAEIAALINPELTIIDARSLLVGNGPMSTMEGAEIRQGVNLLIMGGDPLAVDVVCADILADHDPAFSPSMVSPTHEKAYELKLGVKDAADYELIYVPATGVDVKNRFFPETTCLHPNYPNPFNASTLIRFGLRKRSPVILEIYDILGKKVTTLLNDILDGGEHSVRFEPGNLPGGTYIFRLRAGPEIFARTMSLVR